MNKTYLLSAIALGAMVITWAPVAAYADGLACSQLSAKALQQRTAAGKCDPADQLSPEMEAALAFHEKDKKKGMDKDIDDEPTQEASKDNGEGGEDAGDEGGDEGGAGGTGAGKGKKLPGDKIVQQHPGGEINIGDKPVVKKKQPQGGVVTGEEIEELVVDEPGHTPAIAEEIEELAFGEPEEPILGLAEPEDNIKHFAEPEDNIKHLAEPEDNVKHLAEPEDNIKGLVEPEDKIKGLAEPKKKPSLAEKIEDLFFGEPTKDAFNNDHAGKGDKGGKDNGGKGDKGGKESKGPKGGNGVAG